LLPDRSQEDTTMPQHTGQQPEDELGWYMTGSQTEVADVLSEFAQELRRGDINVWKGQRELHLDPSGTIRLQTEAIVNDDGSEELVMRLRWHTTSASEDLHDGANTGLALGDQGALRDPAAER
jgi:amphi-Trp domain-containing protein